MRKGKRKGENRGGGKVRKGGRKAAKKGEGKRGR